MTIAKGLTSAYAPLSGVIVSGTMWKVLEQGSDQMGPIGHGWTYSAHPLCAAAGVANLQLIDKLGLVENAARGRRLLPRGAGRALSANRSSARCAARTARRRRVRRDKSEPATLFDPALKVGARVAAAPLARGVIGRAMPQGDILGFAPPLCLSREEADSIVEATKGAVEEVAARLQAERRVGRKPERVSDRADHADGQAARPRACMDGGARQRGKPSPTSASATPHPLQQRAAGSAWPGTGPQP